MESNDKHPKVIKVIRKIAANPVTAQSIREQIVDTRIPVAAYARVSTNNEEQEDSLERQMTHYTDLITKNAEWKFAGIYADPGVTGTRADQRKEFQRLLADCRLGLVKKIMCKSISRFARNTVDALKYIRELKELGIGIYFETQNIDTMTGGGDILITILAAIAEQESRNMSENIKWAFQKKFQEGEVHLVTSTFLGYDRDKDKNIIINEEQAKIVRRIYREFLCGYACSAIAKGLMDDGIPTPTGKTFWRGKVIESILTNEKYYGSAYLGKTYKRDVLSKERVERDEVYYVENSHPAIIPKDTWDLAQLEMQRRREMRGVTPSGYGRYSSKYVFSKKLICGECGMPLRRHAHMSRGEYVRTWTCPTHKIKGSDYCTQKYVLERDVEQAFVQALKNIVADMSQLKDLVKDNVMESLDEGKSEKTQRLADTVAELDNLKVEMIGLNRLKRANGIDYTEYAKRANEIADMVEKLEQEQAALQAELGENMETTKRLKDIIEVINGINATDEFSEDTFRMLVDTVLIKGKKCTFNFKVGLSQTVHI